MMKKLEISSKIAIGTTFFFLVALIISQWYFQSKTNHFVNEISKLHIQRDSVLVLLDTSEVSAQYLALQQENQKFQIERFTVELEKQKQSLFAYFVAFLGIGTLAGFYALLFLIPKEIEKRAKLEVDEKIIDAIRGRSKAIRNMLIDYDTETYLLQNKRIFIDGGEGKDKIKQVLEENGFNSDNIFTTEAEASKSGYDAIFINNMNGDVFPNEPKKDDKGNIDENLTKDYQQKFESLNAKIEAEKPVICFFYYCEKNINFPIHKIKSYDLKKRINFATNPAQIYGNLLNTLKYQDKIQQQRQ